MRFPDIGYHTDLKRTKINTLKGLNCKISTVSQKLQKKNQMEILSCKNEIGDIKYLPDQVNSKLATAKEKNSFC